MTPLRVTALSICSFVFSLWPSWLPAQSEIIEKIQLQGNQIIDEDTYLFHIISKVGETYDKDTALADFGRLWETGFLDDLSLDVSDGDRGKIVTFIVSERPRVRMLDFRGSKELGATEIQEKLAEEEAGITIDSFYDPAKVVRAESIIRDMLVDKGLGDGTVSSTIEPLEGGDGIQVIFDIRDESKIRIKSVEFTGAENLSHWQLRWEMKKSRESHILGFLTGGSTFTEETFAEDLEKMRELYLNKGYVNVSFGEPEMEYVDGHARFLFWKRSRRWLHLKIPVLEGRQYRVGTVNIEGAEVLPPEFVKTFFKLQEGEFYSEAKILDGLDAGKRVGPDPNNFNF